MILKSRYVVPVEGSVIENGGVVVRSGVITAIGPARQLPDEGEALDYGDAAIIPGFVNAHTHLELTLLAGQVPPSSDFVDWLRRLVRALTTEPLTQSSTHQAVKLGVEQSLASGVTTVGDITRKPSWTREALETTSLRAVSFGEIIAIGPRRHLLDERLSAALSEEHASRRLRVGVSPHAPYTVEPEAMRACARRADERQAPLCIHLAETAEEELFTRRQAGPFVDYLRDLGSWDEHVPVASCGPVELARRCGLLGRRTVVAHANYVTDGDIASIARSGASVAYCPRTHAAFHHPPHRFRDMLAAGVNVCVGTDSLASNPSLSILEELRFLRRTWPDVPPEQLLAMGTLHGARALGWSDRIGSIEVGKPADLVVVPLESAHDGWESMLDGGGPPRAVYVAGAAR